MSIAQPQRPARTKKQNIIGWAIRSRPDGMFSVFEGGKFRRPFDTRVAAEQFIADQTAPRASRRQEGSK